MSGYLSDMRSLAPLAAVLAAVIVSGCGEAVTDPLRDAFRSDPAPVLGTWVTPDFGAVPPKLYEARIERGAGVLFGQFEFPLHGRGQAVPFGDAIWNGSALVFLSHFDFGFLLADSTVTWAAELMPGRGARGDPSWIPTRLLLTASTIDGPAFQWVYSRREDFLFQHPDFPDVSAGRASVPHAIRKGISRSRKSANPTAPATAM